MRKLNPKPLKRLRLPKGVQIVSVSEIEYNMLAQECCERYIKRQIWDNLINTVRNGFPKAR